MAIPPRSEHLWRYTPWPRIHPTVPTEVPIADAVIFSLEGEDVFEEVQPSKSDVEDIARAFLLAAGGSSNRLVINEATEPIHINARASGHVAVGHLNLEVKGSAVVFIHISGEPEWVGAPRYRQDSSKCSTLLWFYQRTRFQYQIPSMRRLAD